MGRDSPGTFDAVPQRIEREGNGLETAIKKYRMAAYLWQAFTVSAREKEWTAASAFYGSQYNERQLTVCRLSKCTAINLDDVFLDSTRNG